MEHGVADPLVEPSLPEPLPSPPPTRYLTMLPAAAVFLLAELPSEEYKTVAIAFILLPVPFAAAAKMLGLIEPSVPRAVLNRSGSCFANHALLLLICCMFAAPGMTLLVIMHQRDPSVDDVTLEISFWVMCFLPALLPFLRLWPAFDVSFTCVEDETWRSWRHEWWGPGLLTAWRVSGVPGSMSTHTLPLLARCGTVVLVWIAGLRLLGLEGTLGFFWRLILYWPALPWIAVEITRFCAPLHAEYRRRFAER